MKRKPWWLQGPVPQEPSAPAATFAIVAAMLPPAFFLQRSPSHGWQFDVAGTDGRTTTWFVPDQYAHDLNQRLRAHRHVVSVVANQFDDRAVA